MIRVDHPGSESWFFTHPRIPDPGIKSAPDPGWSGSATLTIRGCRGNVGTPSVERGRGESYPSTVPVLYRTFPSWRYPCRWWSIPAGSSAAPTWSPASGSSGSGILKIENFFAFWQTGSGSGRFFPGEWAEESRENESVAIPDWTFLEALPGSWGTTVLYIKSQ